MRTLSSRPPCSSSVLPCWLAYIDARPKYHRLRSIPCSPHHIYPCARSSLWACGRSLAGCGRGPNQIGEFRVVALRNLTLHGRWRLHRALDLPYIAERYELCDLRPAEQKAPDRLGASGWSALGRRQHAHGFCYPRRWTGDRVSTLERQLFGRHLLGLAVVRRTARRESQYDCQGLDRRG